MHNIPTRDELTRAINDPDPMNPLALKISAALSGYANAMSAQAKRSGAVPNPCVVAAPQTEIEAFALELFVAEINAMGIRVSIKGDS